MGLPIRAWCELRKPWAEPEPHGGRLDGDVPAGHGRSVLDGRQPAGRAMPEGWNILIVALIGPAFYAWGVRSAWHNPSLAEVRAEMAVETPAGGSGRSEDEAVDAAPGGDGEKSKFEHVAG
ncbi:hypothetical protein [Streptomyces sp. 8N706]|uniref:hypothetical protein n=1 Tax=Streptomyces sp. 8N706 TaxID=3457416 RepID=UPI003FCF2E7A